MIKHVLIPLAALYLGAWAIQAADAPAAPTTETLESLRAERDALKAERDHLKRQLEQLAAGVRMLQQQRDGLAKQLLDAEVQKAIENAPAGSAGPASEPTALKAAADSK